MAFPIERNGQIAADSVQWSSSGLFVDKFCSLLTCWVIGAILFISPSIGGYNNYKRLGSTGILTLSTVFQGTCFKKLVNTIKTLIVRNVGNFNGQ